MTHHITHSEAFDKRPLAYVQGVRSARNRGALGRWLAYLAAVWLPRRHPTLKGR